MNLQEYVKNRIKELNWTQMELAKQMGVSRVVITQLMKGDKSVSIKRLFKVIGNPEYLTENTGLIIYSCGGTRDE